VLDFLQALDEFDGAVKITTQHDYSPRLRPVGVWNFDNTRFWFSASTRHVPRNASTTNWNDAVLSTTMSDVVVLSVEFVKLIDDVACSSALLIFEMFIHDLLIHDRSLDVG